MRRRHDRIHSSSRRTAGHKRRRCENSLPVKTQTDRQTLRSSRFDHGNRRKVASSGPKVRRQWKLWQALLRVGHACRPRPSSRSRPRAFPHGQGEKLSERHRTFNLERVRPGRRHNSELWEKGRRVVVSHFLHEVIPSSLLHMGRERKLRGHWELEAVESVCQVELQRVEHLPSLDLWEAQQAQEHGSED